MPKLISQRRVSGLGVGELRFTADEIKELLRTGFDRDVTVEEARQLEKQSEGWISAILLTTHSLWKGLLKGLLIDRGPNSLLFDCIASEVFSQQPQAVQDFLLSTSICNKFDAELARALTGVATVGRVLEPGFPIL